MPAPWLPIHLLAAAIMLPAVAGCSSSPASTDPDAIAEARQNNDPYEKYNRVSYSINNGLDTVILSPVARAYNELPRTIRTHTHNFLVNLSTPVTLADDMLQGKPRRAGDSFMRLLINSTVGVAGIFDVAAGWGYPPHDTDFGVTLAIWGFDSGPFLFLPLFGPSDVRDGVGIAGDIGLDPITYVSGGTAVTAAQYGRFGVAAVDARAGFLPVTDQIKRDALDPYATFRSLYQQHRAAQIAETRADNRRTIPVWFPAAAAAQQASGAPSRAVTPTPAPPGNVGDAPTLN